jgi:hypothetical protein
LRERSWSRSCSVRRRSRLAGRRSLRTWRGPVRPHPHDGGVSARGDRARHGAGDSRAGRRRNRDGGRHSRRAGARAKFATAEEIVETTLAALLSNLAPERTTSCSFSSMASVGRRCRSERGVRTSVSRSPGRWSEPMSLLWTWRASQSLLLALRNGGLRLWNAPVDTATLRWG